MSFSPVRFNPPNTLQTDATSALKVFVYQTFEIVNTSTAQVIDRYTLLLNPTDLQQPEKARTALTNTLGGAYVDKFGRGIPEVTIQGTQGYRARKGWEGAILDGYMAFKRLRNDIYRKFMDSTDPNLELRWYNWEDEEYYAIMPMPDGFTLQRSAQESLLYRYNFSFWCLNPLIIGTSIGEPSDVKYHTTGASILKNLGVMSQTIRLSAGVVGAV